MKAVAYFNSLPIDNPDALQDVELPAPTPGPRDLLVEVRAISVNPVDTKVRRNAAPQNGEAKVLGWDVAGVVRAVGEQVSLFKAGDEVFYAGSIAHVVPMPFRPPPLPGLRRHAPGIGAHLDADLKG